MKIYFTKLGESSRATVDIFLMQHFIDNGNILHIFVFCRIKFANM